MFSLFSSNQTFNLVLAMSLAALATATSIELHSRPSELLASLQQRWAEIGTGHSAEAAIEQAAAPKDLSRVEPGPEPDAAPASAPPLTAAPMQAETVAAAAANETVAAAVAGSAAERVPAEAAAAPEAKLAALPAKPGIIFEDLGHKACIGGTACEAHCKIETNGCAALPAYAIKLEHPAYISAVQLYAHDQVGPSRWSELVVKVNGRPVGSAQVHRYGSTRTIQIGRVGQLVTIESRHYHNGFLRGGEEAVIWDVYLLGRKPH